MATKNIKKISKKIKLITKKPVKRNDHNDKVDKVDEAEIEIKKPIEIDAADILPEVEEKVLEEESTVSVLEDEESEEGPSLDSEDLNPFGDKWEM